MSHRRAELRSIAIHRAVAERLRADPALLDRARARVDHWRATGEVHAHYSNAWASALARPLHEFLAFLVEDSEEARELRQVSPFAGALDARTRWTILRETRR